ncbi:MAG TPA: DinB family protein [Candidatus Limnocylindria bacterium]|nr:DinB family protein [Candidatus Limnocylindria bacterium]
MGNESVGTFYEGWSKHNRRLVDSIRSLADDQLKLRAAPEKWPIWAIAAHTAGARVYWLCGVFKESGAESTPFTDPASGLGWEDDERRPRGSRELVTALDSSWAIVARCLDTWTTPMLSEEYTREIGGKTQRHTRQSVLMRLLTHDAYHSGEISQILGAHGLPEIDLWRPAPA